ncbi:hypothetical protein [Rubrivivax sp. A210]|uniref:hypothetical protein n=1 Tax=Rubrivivax sp. A210 TaxID=2772301 RepID=UPI00191A2DF1|nr:hypothetical protein [Rubrivivax sp. A210]
MPAATHLGVDATIALLDASRAQVDARRQAADMLTVTEAAALGGTTEAVLRRWIATGRCLGLASATDRQDFAVPRWQFQADIWRALLKLPSALNTTSGWELLSFLESPTGALSGRTPRSAIEQGEVDRVLVIAAYDK